MEKAQNRIRKLEEDFVHKAKKNKRIKEQLERGKNKTVLTHK